MRYLLALVLISAVAGCGSSSFDVKGTLTLSGDPTEIHWLNLSTDPADGDPCEGDTGYSDIAEGAPVVVRDSKGDKVGIGELKAGHAKDGACAFRFTVPGVDDSGRIFSVEVGNHGEVSFKRSEASSVDVTLGS